MDKLIVGLVGPLGVGKTTVANYLVSKDFVRLGLSDPLRLELKKQKKEVSRENLQDLGDSWRNQHGLDYLAQLLIQTINKCPADKFVVEGFRNPGEIEPFQTFPNFILIGLTADPKVRFDRVKARKVSTDPGSWEDFQKQESRDQGIGQPRHGQQVVSSLEQASFVVDTDKVESEVFSQVDKIIKEHTDNARAENTRRSQGCTFC